MDKPARDAARLHHINYGVKRNRVCSSFGQAFWDGALFGDARCSFSLPCLMSGQGIASVSFSAAADVQGQTYTEKHKLMCAQDGRKRARQTDGRTRERLSLGRKTNQPIGDHLLHGGIQNAKQSPKLLSVKLGDIGYHLSPRQLPGTFDHGRFQAPFTNALVPTILDFPRPNARATNTSKLELGS